MLNRLDFQAMKANNEKITMLTAYDYPSAKLAEAADVDMILVGDSLGMVVLGYDSTIEVTVDDMIHHAKAVKRGAKNTYTVVDMPFMSYHVSLAESLKHARDIFQQTRAQAIKIEGASPEILELTRRLTAGGIPVVGHLGLTPQTVNVLGGYKVQGRSDKARAQLLADAKQLADHGAVALVLECVPKSLGAEVTQHVAIPTIGIGAGLDCDGQVLVYHDILQYGVSRLPKFVQSYADFNQVGTDAIKQYVSDVRTLAFPLEEHTFKG